MAPRCSWRPTWRGVRLAASVARQAFAWLNTQDLFARTPADTAINELLATTTTLYIELFSQSCTSHCPGFLRSRDGGASWSPFHSLFQGQPASLLAMGEDGRTMLGEISEGSTPTSRVYVRSGDGGDTWRALPRLPEGLLASTMTATPDGTVYAAFDQIFATAPQEAELGIYKVVPGASAWRCAASLPPGSWFLAASDAAGRTVALWGKADTSALPSGMERHQP